MKQKRIEFSGTIEHLRELQTKTGTKMAKFGLKAGEHLYPCQAFGNTAEAILTAGDGREIDVTRSDLEVTVWSFEIDGAETVFEKNNDRKQPSPTNR